MNAIFSRNIDSQPATVDTVQRLVSIQIKNGRLTTTYNNVYTLLNGIEYVFETFTVDRALEDVEQALQDWVSNGASLIEKLRQADADKRVQDEAAAEVEIARYSALTPDEQRAEREAAFEAKFGIRPKIL